MTLFVIDDSLTKPFTAEELAALKANNACSGAEKLLATVLLTAFYGAVLSLAVL